MYYNSIYSQLFNFIPRYRFEKIVKKSGGNRYCKHFTAWKQFLTLLFAQISGKDSLREIENALLANHKRLYHLGMEAVAKSTLSEAMNRRNPEIFKALFEEILDRVMAVAPKLSYLQSGKADHGKKNGDDPEADGYSTVRNPFSLIMMVQRSHQKYSFAAGVTEINLLNQR